MSSDSLYRLFLRSLWLVDKQTWQENGRSWDISLPYTKLSPFFVHDASGAWPNSVGSLPHSSSDAPSSIDMASHCGCWWCGITPDSSNGWMMMMIWMIFHKEWSAIGQTPMSIPRPSKGLCKCLPCCHTFITSSFIAHTGFPCVHACHACHVTHAAGFGVTAAEDTTHAIFNSAPLANLVQASTLRYPNNTSRSLTVKVFPTDRTKDMDYTWLHCFVPDRCRFSS